MVTPLITEIQRFSLQDGPGIRTTVFLKGCPLHCPWCHNPENIGAKREFYFHPLKCTGCGECREGCPASETGAGTALGADRSDCTLCLRCVPACRFGAREAVGKALDLDTIVTEAVSDKLFYQNSGGGVTISGGEPLLFPEFTLELARTLKKKEKVHVAIETSLFARWEKIKPLLKVVDLFIVDIKTMDPEKHREAIGGSLPEILGNLEKLVESGAKVRIHLPIIPRFNDTAKDFEAYAGYLGGLAAQLVGVDLLPYHSYATGKYTQLGRRYDYLGARDLPNRQLIPLVNLLEQKGIREITVGGLGGATPAGG